MPMLTIVEFLKHAATLRTDGNGRHLRADAAWCMTPAGTLPPRLRAGQHDHRHAYMNGKGRGSVDHAPRYIVTSYSVLIGWVTYDGAVRFATDDEISTDLATVRGAQGARSTGAYLMAAQRRYNAVRRHRDALRNTWPARFATRWPAGGDRDVLPRPKMLGDVTAEEWREIAATCRPV